MFIPIDSHHPLEGPAVTKYDYKNGNQCGVRSTDPLLGSTEAFMQYFNTCVYCTLFLGFTNTLAFYTFRPVR